MDRNSIIALILIAIIILFLPYYEKIIKPPSTEVYENSSVQKKDSLVDRNLPEKTRTPQVVSKERDVIPPATQTKGISEQDSLIDKNVVQDNEERTVTIENGNIRVVLSNKGGGNLKAYYLKKFKKYDSTYVNFIDPLLNNNMYFAFIDKNGNLVNTSNFLFKTDYNPSDKYLKDGDTFSINYYFYYMGKKISKKITFYGGKYHFDVVVNIEDPDEILLNDQYQIGWKNGIPLTEINKTDDNNYSHAYVYMADELENYKIKDEGQQKPLNLTGSADWLAIRTKYFLTSVVNNDKENIVDGIYIGGKGKKEQKIVVGLYDVMFNARYNKRAENSYRYYIGPLDYNELKKYNNNLDILILNNGWYERTFRFFSLLILPVLEFLYKFIPNYGLVIILFSILIKILLYPLTKKSYMSMRQMQMVQPLMTELRKKYKDDPQRLNKEMMKLYKEHGVNPMGGCLPMLLQMPLLFALFIVFRSTIQLRGAPFIPGWINDLSRSEGLLTLPFSLPFYGNEFNILPVLMAITMIFQSKMTTQDPKQKAMIYLMPIFMLLIFNTLPSGLNLYYTMFNLLTIIQQIFINRGSKAEGKDLVAVSASAKKLKKGKK